MDKKELESAIKELELRLKKDKGNSVIIYQLKGLYDLREEDKKNDEKSGKVTRGKMEEEKRELKNKKEELKENGGNIDEYLKIEKDIKKINNQIREMKNEIHYLSELEFKRLKANVRKNKNNGEKYLLIILLAYEGALRVSELVNLKISDISIEEKTMLCRRIKGSNTNTIILTDNTFKLLEKYIKKNKIDNIIFKNRGGEKYTPIAINKMFKLYCDKVAIPRNKQRFHSLKHSRAVHLANEGLTLQEIQFMLGHKSITSTMVYFRFTKTQEQNIYTKLSGY